MVRAQVVAAHPFGHLARLGQDGVDAQAGEGTGPVRAGRREPDIGHERVLVGRGHQHQGGVHDDRAQDGLKLGPAQVLPLHQHAADVAVRPVRVGDQVRCGGGRPERARQARAEVRDPRRPGERDLPLVQVDRAGWIPLDL